MKGFEKGNRDSFADNYNHRSRSSLKSCWPVASADTRDGQQRRFSLGEFELQMFQNTYLLTIKIKFSELEKFDYSQGSYLSRLK